MEADPLPSILVVDDNAAVRGIFRYYLRSDGYPLLEAETASRALILAQTAAVGMVYLDIRLPDMSGLDVLKYLRALAAHRATPILMVTALGTREIVLESIRQGATDCLIKPFSRALIREKTRRFFGAPPREAPPAAPPPWTGDLFGTTEAS